MRFALPVTQLDEMIGGGAGQVLAEGLAGRDLVEAVRKGPGQSLAAFTLVHHGAIGRDRDHRVVGAKVEIFGELDCRQHIADARQAQRIERADECRVDATSLNQIVTANIGVEQQVEAVGRGLGNRRDEVGVHHVVDERHVLVADALDIVSWSHIVGQLGSAVKVYSGS